LFKLETGQRSAHAWGIVIGGFKEQRLAGYTGWLKKVSHYRESSLHRIKNRQPVAFSPILITK